MQSQILNPYYHSGNFRPNPPPTGNFLREAFVTASSHAKIGKPSVIFIEDLDELCSLPCGCQLSGLLGTVNKSATGPQVVVVASTSKLDAIDTELRRSGRYDTDVEVTTPNEDERFQFLKRQTKNVPMDSNVDLRSIAASCNGYVWANLQALCSEATMSAFKRSSDQNVFSVKLEDWDHAISVVGPRRGGVAVYIPKVTWEDIGGLEDVKRELKKAVEWPNKYSASFGRLGVSPERVIFLHGPPGCSKTMLSKAAAHAANASYLSLSCTELCSMSLPEGAALLRDTFRRARREAPSIIFLNEVDGVATNCVSNSSSKEYRLVSALRIEIDGLEWAEGVFLLAASNRPANVFDAGLIRNGRFDKVLYVAPPDLKAQYQILCVHTRNMQIGDDVDLQRIAEDTELFTGTELEYLCMEAGIEAVQENISAAGVCVIVISRL